MVGTDLRTDHVLAGSKHAVSYQDNFKKDVSEYTVWSSWLPLAIQLLNSVVEMQES